MEQFLAQVEHGQGHENHMVWVTHPLEIPFPKELGNGRSGNRRVLWYEHEVITLLITTAIIAVMLHVVVQEDNFPANWTGGIDRSGYPSGISGTN